MEAIILDTETSGMGEDAEVMQLAYVELDARFYEVGNAFQAYYQPTRPVGFGALATHHITPEQLRLNKAFTTPPLAPPASYYIGHNVDFDWKALGSPPGVKRICTLALARWLWPDMDSHSLGACCYKISEDVELTRMRLREAHNALADVLLCSELLGWIVREKQVADVHSLWMLSEMARIPTIMPFGKHKGERIVDIPRHYKTWALKQPDFDEYVLKAFRSTM